MLTEREIKEVFDDSKKALEVIEEANKKTLRYFGKEVHLERALFLSWFCSIGDCKFCYMSTQKERIKDPKRARRSIYSILAETEICRRIGMDIEFLSSGYGAYTVEEINEIADMVSYVYGDKLFLNVGIIDVYSLTDSVEGIVGSVETINPKLHKKLCPSKPIEPIEKMLKEAKNVGLKTCITVILGIGERPEDLALLFDFIERNEIDKVVFYTLLPHERTIFADKPTTPSIYMAKTIALTRLNFPKLWITAGTWLTELANIGVLLLSGANAITKYPLFKIFGNRFGKKVEEEIKSANRIPTATLTDFDALLGKKVYKKRKFVKKDVETKISGIWGKVEEKIDSYIKSIYKNSAKLGNFTESSI